MFRCIILINSIVLLENQVYDGGLQVSHSCIVLLEVSSALGLHPIHAVWTGCGKFLLKGIWEWAHFLLQVLKKWLHTNFKFFPFFLNCECHAVKFLSWLEPTDNSAYKIVWNNSHHLGTNNVTLWKKICMKIICMWESFLITTLDCLHLIVQAQMSFSPADQVGS